jgi:hypothetical protein
MLLKKIITGILIIACSAHSIAQTNNYAQPQEHHFAVYAGIGPNFYFNNLEIGKNYVNDFNYSFAGRFMWEPEHLLSLGVESGYYRLYTFNAPGVNKVHITNTAIPLQVVVSMKFLTSFYLNFSMGQSILLNRASSETLGNFKASSLSVADFTGTFGYRHRLSNRFSIATEAKYFYSSSFVDRSIALVFVGGYRF